jgi:putative flavoprotein involved in K+ transport
VPVERVDTLVIGGGQAGLTMSHRLKQRGLSHLVLERHRIAERWRSVGDDAAVLAEHIAARE